MGVGAKAEADEDTRCQVVAVVDRESPDVSRIQLCLDRQHDSRESYVSMRAFAGQGEHKGKWVGEASVTMTVCMRVR